MNVLTPEEVADRLKINVRTVYKFLKPDGPLHHCRIQIGTKTVRVDADAFEQYMTQEAKADAST